MNKIVFLLVYWGVTAVFAQISFPVHDFFDNVNPGWENELVIPRSISPGNYIFARNISLATEGIPVPPGSNGRALKMEVNRRDNVVQHVSAMIGQQSWSDYSVSWRQLVTYRGSSGTTEFHGVGIRTEGFRENGYFVEIRTDESGYYGDYFNFIKYIDGIENTINRIYFKLGDQGRAYVDSPTVNLNPGGDPTGCTNIWIEYKIEAIGSTIKLYVNDMNNPVYVYDDPHPYLSGKVAVFAHDPWDSIGVVPSYIDYLIIEDMTEDTGMKVTDIVQAFRTARNRNRDVLLYFYTPQVEHCRNYDRYFEAPDFQQKLDSYIVVPVNLAENPEYAATYNIFRVPAIVVKDPNQREQFRITRPLSRQELLDRL